MKYWHKYCNETEWQLDKNNNILYPKKYFEKDYQSQVKNSNFCIIQKK